MTDDDGSTGTDTNDATATVTNTAPAISVDKSASAAQAEPGGAFTFTVLVTNDSAEDVNVTSIDDAPYGDLLDADNPAVANNTCPTIDGATITANGGTRSCTFEVSYSDAGAYADTVTVVATDDDGSTGSDTDDATATVTDTAPTLTVAKGGPASIAATGGAATFTVDIANTSAEAVDLDSIIDSVFGDLTDAGGAGPIGLPGPPGTRTANALLDATTCDTAPASLAANDGALGGPDEYSCTFTATIAGNAGTTHVNTVTVTFDDNDGAGPYSAADDHTVTFTAGPPPPPPPPPPPGACVPFDPGPVRVMGVTRIETAIASSQRVFCDGEALGVVLTRSDLFPDAQAGTPLAIDKDAAMLLSEPATLNPATEAEILRVLPAGGTVYLLGGTAALSRGGRGRASTSSATRPCATAAPTASRPRRSSPTRAWATPTRCWPPTAVTSPTRWWRARPRCAPAGASWRR